MALRQFLAPRAGLEPATTRLTAECSTIELSRNIIIPYRAKPTLYAFGVMKRTHAEHLTYGMPEQV